MIKPLFNNCLIEVIDEYDGIVGSDKATNIQHGILLEYHLIPDHLTAATGYVLFDGVERYEKILKSLVGKTVYWQEYADAGSKFTVDGKDYVLIPWYRLTAQEA